MKKENGEQCNIQASNRELTIEQLITGNSYQIRRQQHVQQHDKSELWNPEAVEPLSDSENDGFFGHQQDTNKQLTYLQAKKPALSEVTPIGSPDLRDNIQAQIRNYDEFDSQIKCTNGLPNKQDVQEHKSQKQILETSKNDGKVMKVIKIILQQLKLLKHNSLYF